MLSETGITIPVFIVHWNRPQECLNTVRSFIRERLPLEVKVVDNASSLENFKILKEQLPLGVELVRLAENKGWGGGLNVLLQQWLAEEGTPYCFVSAHDALPQEQCLSMLLNSMENDSTIGIACPEYGIPELPKYSPVKGPYIIPTPARIPGTVESVDFAHATLLILRKACINQIGLFDARHFAYGEEYDISLKARLHHWKVAIVWGAIVVNPGSWTPKAKLSYLSARNTLLLALTYGGWSKAMLRAVLMLLNTFRLSLNPFSRDVFFPRARILGVRDFFLKRYGPPPI